MSDNRPKGDIQIPLGYRGNAFPPPQSPQKAQPRDSMPQSHPEMPKMSETAFEKLREFPAMPVYKDSTEEHYSESNESVAVCESSDRCELCDKNDPSQKRSGLGSILSPEGSLDAEELLILAIALIVFQGGKENELALLLIALLFIK